MNNGNKITKNTLFNILLLAFILLPSACLACEPVIPMAMLYSGTTIFGAVILKSVVGLLIAIAIKCAVFFWKSDLKGFRSILYMIAANVYSTVPGIFLGLAFAAPVVIIILYPILLIPAGNMKNYKPFKRFGRFGNAGILLVLIFISMFIFGAAMSQQDSSLTVYWMLKIIYSTLAVAISFLISVVCEDGIISYLYEKKYKIKKSFLDPVIWANAAVFIVVMSIGAAIALPKRFASPNSLIGAIKLLVSYFGLG